MKTLLVTLVLATVGVWQLNEHPYVLTLTPIEETEPIVTEAPEPASTVTETVPTKPQTTPRPTPTPTPPTPTSVPAEEDAPPPQENNYAAQVEELVLQKTNIERVKNDLSELSFNRTLASIAHNHSADMQANNYFAHEDPAGCDSSCRADDAGYRWQMIGENIYMMSGFKISAEAAAEKIVQGWMNSPGHRANILRSEYTQTGVGVVAIGNDIYATTVYAKPR